MADKRDLDFTYSLIDRIFRLSVGETADFSGAMYDGDFTMTLEEAQHRKHQFIVRALRVGRGSRVLDLGCGWGALLAHLKGLGATGVGLSLSKAQVGACRKNGLDAHLMDCRTIEKGMFGSFDAVASLGAFEHFCSPTDYRAGKQDAIYHDLFRRVSDLLPENGRFYLQTMVFGRNMIPAEQLDVEAPRNSDAFHLGLMSKLFPGSWLPYGREQLESAAHPYFHLVSVSSGRLDYIETIRQWRKRFAKRSVRKTLLKLSLVPHYLLSRDFRLAFVSGVSANSVCFERELMDHFRLVFEKQPG